MLELSEFMMGLLEIFKGFMGSLFGTFDGVSVILHEIILTFDGATITLDEVIGWKMFTVIRTFNVVTRTLNGVIS